MSAQTIKSATLVTSLTLGAMLCTSLFAATPLTLEDIDGDGVISAEEVKQAHEARKEAIANLFDTDGDGELSEDERQAAREAKRAERVAIADTNGDGELSRAERRAARQAHRDAIEAQLDVNGDGVVSDAEGAGFDQAREAHREGKRGHGKGGRGGDRL